MTVSLSKSVYLKFDESSGNFYLFCVSTGQHFKINKMGAVIWRLLEEGKGTKEIVRLISSKFSINIDTCADDIEAFLDYLKQKNLIVKKKKMR